MITCEGGKCRLQGPVTMGNVMALLEQGEKAFTQPDMVLDLSEITEVDSTAISLLFEWRRRAQAGGRHIAFVGLPPNLTSLAELYGVTELIAGAGN